MNKYSLSVLKRAVLGKKVKKLRKDGILPANIYGKDITSIAVQLPFKDFVNVYKEAGETGLVDIHIDKETLPVLIHNVQLDYMTQEPVHADFYKVNLKEKVKTMVPVVLTGEPKAVADKLGLLLQTLNELEVEALPADLPEKIEVDVTNLAAVNDQITIADITTPAGVIILTDKGQTIAKISELVTQEEEPQPAPEAAAGEETTAEGAEGEAPESTEESKGTKETNESKEERK